MVLQLGSALDTGVPHLAHLNRVELVPLAPVELAVKIREEGAADEVEEGIAHVAVVLNGLEGTL